MSSELENSGIRVAVGDCSVTERRRWRPPYQTGKTVHVHAKHNKGGCTALDVCGNGSVPLSHSGNVVTRIGIHSPQNKGINALRSDFTSNLVHGLAVGTPKFCMAPYDKISYGLVNLSYKCDVKSGLSLLKVNVNQPVVNDNK